MSKERKAAAAAELARRAAAAGQPAEAPQGADETGNGDIAALEAALAESAGEGEEKVGTASAVETDTSSSVSVSEPTLADVVAVCDDLVHRVETAEEAASEARVELEELRAVAEVVSDAQITKVAGLWKQVHGAKMDEVSERSKSILALLGKIEPAFRSLEGHLPLFRGLVQVVEYEGESFSLVDLLDRLIDERKVTAALAAQVAKDRDRVERAVSDMKSLLYAKTAAEPVTAPEPAAVTDNDEIVL